MNASESLPILLLDDEINILKATSMILQNKGFERVLAVQDGHKVIGLLQSQPVGVVIMDLVMPGIRGTDLLATIVSNYPGLPVIMMTAADDAQSAVECIRSGAFDYLVKPVEADRLVATVTKALEVHALTKEVSSLKEYLLNDCLVNPGAFSEIKTRDKRMRGIFQYIEVIAPSRQPVLITGETGVGKDLLAKAIHGVCRCKGEFIAVNVAGLDDAMFSDTLFGHKRGAYTGADQPREGLIARAVGGTIFLDEIGDLSDSSQIKLLRLLQEHEYYPVGSDVPRRSDARVIVATNKSLKSLMASGKFRNDLYYRLCTHQIEIPPLRERPDDIPLLVEHFLSKSAAALGKKKPKLSSELIRIFYGYSFPGNIRELEAMIYDAVARSMAGELSLHGLKEGINANSKQDRPIKPRNPEDANDLLMSIFGQFPSVRQMEDFMILEATKKAKGNQGAAASLLGITRQTLNKRLREIRKSEAQATPSASNNDRLTTAPDGQFHLCGQDPDSVARSQAPGRYC